MSHTFAFLAVFMASILATSVLGQNWSNDEFQCAAAHHVCVNKLAQKHLGDRMHREICNSCYFLCDSNKCNQSWCFSNAANSIPSPGKPRGCLYQAARGFVTNWNTATRYCAAAHAACKYSATNFYLRGQFCRQCRQRCVFSSSGCNQSWCNSNRAQC